MLPFAPLTSWAVFSIMVRIVFVGRASRPFLVKSETFFEGKSSQGMKLSTQLRLISRLRCHVVLSSLRSTTFVACYLQSGTVVTKFTDRCKPSKSLTVSIPLFLGYYELLMWAKCEAFIYSDLSVYSSVPQTFLLADPIYLRKTTTNSLILADVRRGRMIDIQN